MARFTLTDPAPDDAEIHGTLKIHRWEEGGRYYAKTWRGRAQKPYAFFVWKRPETREQWIENQKAAEDSRVKMKREIKEAQARRKAQMVEAIGVGTILHDSWGYEQTNCDFYQVVEKKGQTVTLRKIGAKDVGPQGFMSTHLKPVPDQFAGEPFKKRITANGVKVKHGIASPIDPDQTFYSSWYA